MLLYTFICIKFSHASSDKAYITAPERNTAKDILQNFWYKKEPEPEASKNKEAFHLYQDCPLAS